MRSVSEMISQLQEFVVDKAQALNDQVTRIRQGSVKSARVAVQGSAESLKGLKNPVRLVARSGVRLSTVSQTAVQELIELQSEALTAALTEFALRLAPRARCCPRRVPAWRATPAASFRSSRARAARSVTWRRRPSSA